MRKLIYSMTVSLDGYIAGPDGAIDWSVPDEELFLLHTQHVQELGVHLCGRRLYETMVYWETAQETSLSEVDSGFHLPPFLLAWLRGPGDADQVALGVGEVADDEP